MFRIKKTSIDREVDGPDFASVGLNCAKMSMKILRAARLFPEKMIISRKYDGTLTTQFDASVERKIRRYINRLIPSAIFVGEESGGNIDGDGLYVAVDPIDGTNSFITHDKTNSFSLSVIDKRNIIFAVIACPATGEIFYASGRKKSVLMQSGLFGENDLERKLPSSRGSEKIRIDMQYTPYSRTREIIEKAKYDGLINSFKSSRGSPSLSFAEAAKGHYIYVCDWHNVESRPYDISAGFKILKNAGGSIIDAVSGKEIDPFGYKGTLIAGIDGINMMQVRGLFL